VWLSAPPAASSDLSHRLRGLSPEAAKRAVTAWEEEALRRGLARWAPDHWTTGEAWIAERRWT
jgi:hypothetical protein